MKDFLATQLERAKGDRRNLVREYLQARILESMQRSGAMISLAFQGGTSLRFLYSISRFSEDLDFALEGDRRTCDLRKVLESVRRTLEPEGYSLAIRLNDRRAVNCAFIGFPGLLYEMGASPHRSESLSVKLEVDTRPPAGATLETSVVRRYVTLRLHHHDKSSLLAGKLHCLLHRPYLKGRDVFDLVWYLSDPRWPAPNLRLLENSLVQSGHEKPRATAEHWRRRVRKRLESADWPRVLADVEPFLEPGFDLTLLEREAVLKLLAG